MIQGATPPKRDVPQGTLDLIVLRMLQAGPANGWQLTRQIQVVSRAALDVNYGSIYPARRRPEAKGARGHLHGYCDPPWDRRIRCPRDRC